MRKETFFRFNRYFLFGGLITAILLPSFYLTKDILVPLSSISQNNGVFKETNAVSLEGLWNASSLFVVIYSLGAIFFLIKFLKQLLQLQSILKGGRKQSNNETIHIHTHNQVLPFSFFNKIVYNPAKHNQNELEAIIAHEEVHAKQFHSLDILVTEIVLALQWFNPFIWLYRIAIKQNLEYLADTENTEVKNNKKAYQYILLQQACSNYNLSIVNPFFNSLIKKRIVMINQKQSHKLKVLKSLLIVPLLAFFLVSFNTKEVYIFSDSKV